MGKLKGNYDNLGLRMKGYELDSKTYLNPNKYIIIRLDGKAFHTYTKGLNRPFDDGLVDDMSDTTRFLCKNIQGAFLGYTQSDEITILIPPYPRKNSSVWFDGNVQKVCSIAASLCTAHFNKLRAYRGIDKLAFFDARVFELPDSVEAMNCLIWRQRDCIKNSIAMLAQSKFSHKELHKVNTTQMKEKLLTELNINWEDLHLQYKNGTIVKKYRKIHENDGTFKNQPKTFIRSEWSIKGAEIFKIDDDLDINIPPRNYLENDELTDKIIPVI